MKGIARAEFLKRSIGARTAVPACGFLIAGLVSVALPHPVPDLAGILAIALAALAYFTAESLPREFSLAPRLIALLISTGLAALISAGTGPSSLLLPPAAAVLLVSLLLQGSLVLTERGPLTLRAFRLLVITILLGSAVPAVGLSFRTVSIPLGGMSADPVEFDPYISLLTLLAILNGFRARWVHYLDLKGKVICIAGCIIAVNLLQIATRSLSPAMEGSPVLGTLAHSCAYSLQVGAVVGLIVLLLSLPSARLVDRRARELRSLQEMGSVLLESTQLPEICSRAAKLCRKLTGADTAWVEIDDGNGSSHIAASSGTNLLGEGIPGTGLSGWLEARYPMAAGSAILSSVPRSFPLENSSAGGLRIGSLAAAPLAAGGSRMGMLFAARAARFGFLDESKPVFEAFAAQVSAAIRNSHLLKAGIERERIMEELALARSIQQGLLPQAPPAVEGLDLAGVNYASTEVGGDYFDLLCTSSKGLAFAIADVAGKGAPAALLMAAVQAGLHSLLDTPGTPADIAKRLNRFLCGKSPGDKFVTFFLGFIDPGTGAFAYCNAGHDPPLLVRSGGEVEELSEGGLVLGVLEEAEYESGYGRLGEGDLVLLYTDGVTETLLDGTGPEFGRDRVARCVAESIGLPASEVLSRLLRRVEDYRGDAGQHDDLTLVVVRKRPEG